jgi:hypothetical protein
VDTRHFPTIRNRNDVNVVVAVPVLGVHNVADMQEPPVELDARRGGTQRPHSKETDEAFLDRGIREVEVVVPDDVVERAASRNEPSQRPEEHRVSICDRLKPLNARGNGPDESHTPVESCEIERIAEHDKPDPVTRVTKLLTEVLDEKRECERGVGLVR